LRLRQIVQRLAVHRLAGKVQFQGRLPRRPSLFFGSVQAIAGWRGLMLGNNHQTKKEPGQPFGQTLKTQKQT